MLYGSDLHLVSGIFKELSILDRLLTPLILVCMIVGVLIGNYVSGVQEAFDTVCGPSFPLATTVVDNMICSHRHRSTCHDVANSHEGPIRGTSQATLTTVHVDACSHLSRIELDCRSFHHARSCVGNITRPAYISHWLVHLSYSALYSVINIMMCDVQVSFLSVWQDASPWS
jgi:hypothetical protein